jgi:lipid-binding SYLF domain-containing protein
MENLMSNKFQVGGEASAAAGPIGRHASAGTDWKADTEILTYSRSKGIFAGVNLGGSWISQDGTATMAYYGRELGDNQILGGQVTAPSADPFVAEVDTLQTRIKTQAAQK